MSSILPKPDVEIAQSCYTSTDCKLGLILARLHESHTRVFYRDLDVFDILDAKLMA